MATSITQFRKDIFTFANDALKGKDVTFMHKGKVLRLVPAQKANKLDRLTPMQVFNPNWVEPAISYQEEMQQEWEKKWADRFDRLP